MLLLLFNLLSKLTVNRTAMYLAIYLIILEDKGKIMNFGFVCGT